METKGNKGKDVELSDTNGKVTTFQNPNGSAKSVGTDMERKTIVHSEKKGSPEKHGKNKGKNKVSRWQLARQPYIKKTPGPGDKGTEKKRPFGVKRPGHQKSTQRPGHKSTPKPGHKSTPKPGHKSTPKPGHKTTRRPPGQKKPKPVRKAKPVKISQSHKKSPKNKKKQTQGAGAHKTSTKKSKPSHSFNKEKPHRNHKKKGSHGKKPNDTPAFFKKTGDRVSMKNQMKHKDNKRSKMIEKEQDSEEHRRLDRGKKRENSKKTKDEKGDTQENDKRLFGRGSREAIGRMGNHLQPHGPRRVSKQLNQLNFWRYL